MALPDEKLDADAKRAKTRGFGGYLKDRLTGSADFATEAKSKTAEAMGSGNKQNKAILDEAGRFKKGGVVKTKSRW
jgi:hypothetical protein